MKNKSASTQLLIASLVVALVVSACSSQEPTAAPTAAPTATEAAAIEGTTFTVFQGGYSFTAPLECTVSIEGPSATLSSDSDSLLFSLIGLYDMSEDKDAATILDTMLSSLFSAEQSNLKKSDPISATVEGNEGIAYDFSGKFSASEVEGRAFVVKPSQDRYVFMLGMAMVGEQADLWQTSGKDLFNAILASLVIIPEEELTTADLCPISPDKDYGFLPENPIKVGGGLDSGLMRELAFLDNLLGPNGEEVTYERVGSIESPDSIVDEYKLTVGSQEFTLYLDEYSFGVINAPRGLGCMGAFPISEP